MSEVFENYAFYLQMINDTSACQHTHKRQVVPVPTVSLALGEWSREDPWGLLTIASHGILL